MKNTAGLPYMAALRVYIGVFVNAIKICVNPLNLRHLRSKKICENLCTPIAIVPMAIGTVSSVRKGKYFRQLAEQISANSPNEWENV